MRRDLPLRKYWAAAAGALVVAALCCTQPALAAERVVFGEGFVNIS